MVRARVGPAVRETKELKRSLFKAWPTPTRQSPAHYRLQLVGWRGPKAYQRCFKKGGNFPRPLIGETFLKDTPRTLNRVSPVLNPRALNM